MLVCFESLLILLSFYSTQGEPDKYHKEHFWLHLKMFKCHAWLAVSRVQDKGPSRAEDPGVVPFVLLVFFSTA